MTHIYQMPISEIVWVLSRERYGLTEEDAIAIHEILDEHNINPTKHWFSLYGRVMHEDCPF